MLRSTGWKMIAGGIMRESLALPYFGWTSLRLLLFLMVFGFVYDTGPGISNDDLPKLFSPGTQLDPNTKGLAGLGLASVKSVIETHNGRVWVESEPEKGTTFYFSLPVQGSNP